MIQILAGEKGEGKTKRLIEMANEAGKEAKGSVVFIDDDKRHMYDLKPNLRFVETSEFKVNNYETLIGFIYGLISQNRDIEKIYIDGLAKIVKNISSEDINDFILALEKISEKNDIDFTLIVSGNTNSLPAKVKEFAI